MKSIHATWFETKVRYSKILENGSQKKVTETYVVDAVSFSEAETRITEEMTEYVSGEFSITDEKIAAYSEIVFKDDVSDDKWYKVKVQFITVNERTNAVKRSNSYLLVQAFDLEAARKITDEYFNGTMLDYVIASVVETPIMDVYRYKNTNDNE